jgi:hypothetical protein
MNSRTLLAASALLVATTAAQAQSSPHTARNNGVRVALPRGAHAAKRIGRAHLVKGKDWKVLEPA